MSNVHKRCPKCSWKLEYDKNLGKVMHFDSFFDTLNFNCPIDIIGRENFKNLMLLRQKQVMHIEL